MNKSSKKKESWRLLVGYQFSKNTKCIAMFTDFIFSYHDNSINLLTYFANYGESKYLKKIFLFSLFKLFKITMVIELYK